MVKEHTLSKSLVKFLLNEYGWEESFNINFGMTSDEFLIAFHGT